MRNTDADRELVELYLSECGQLVQKLETAFLNAERSEELTDLAEMFRLLHTLKGSSAMMEYTPLVETAHAFENILAAIRKTGRALEADELQALIDVGLEFTAVFQTELAHLQAGGLPEKNGELDDAIQALSVLMGVTAGKAAAAAEPTPRPDGAQVQITLRSCPIPHIRAFLVVRGIQKLCALTVTTPDSLDKATDADDTILQEGFILRFVPAAGVTQEDVVRKLAAQPYVTAVRQVDAEPAQSEPPDAAAYGESLQTVAVPQALLNSLVSYLSEIASGENAVELCAAETGLTSRRLEEQLASLRQTIAEANLLADRIGARDVSSVFFQMQRTVRTMAKELGKQIKVRLQGADVQVDKSILELLSDSMIHMVRNAADHGIEFPGERKALGKDPAGRITLTAEKQNGYLTITVTDDGAGVGQQAVLDRAADQGKLTKPKDQYTYQEACELLLSAGVSTNQEVTQFSGRGVGLDTVVRRVRQAGGQVGIHSQEGQGTTLTLQIPVTLMVVSGIQTVLEDGSEVIVPTNAVAHVLSGTGPEDRLFWEGKAYTCLRLPGQRPAAAAPCALVLEASCGPYFLRARQVGMTATCYVKPMPAYVADALGRDYLYSGCVLCADARLRCVLDAARLAAAAQTLERSERQWKL